MRLTARSIAPPSAIGRRSRVIGASAPIRTTRRSRTCVACGRPRCTTHRRVAALPRVTLRLVTAGRRRPPLTSPRARSGRRDPWTAGRVHASCPRRAAARRPPRRRTTTRERRRRRGAACRAQECRGEHRGRRKCRGRERRRRRGRGRGRQSRGLQGRDRRRRGRERERRGRQGRGRRGREGRGLECRERREHWCGERRAGPSPSRGARRRAVLALGLPPPAR